MLFAASVVPTYAWFRQALTVLLPLALVLLAVTVVLDPPQRPVAAVGGGGGPARAGTHLLERALTVPVIVVALLLAAGPTGRRTKYGWRRGAAVLAPFVVVNVLFLAAYSSGDYDTARGSRPGVLDAVVKVGRWAFVDLLPSFLGGPVVWRPGNARTRSRTARPCSSAAAAMLLLAFVVAARTPGSLRSVAPVALGCAAYAVPVLAMVYVGRLAQVDDITAADDLRLLPASAPPSQSPSPPSSARSSSDGPLARRRRPRDAGSSLPPSPVPQRCSAASRG